MTRSLRPAGPLWTPRPDARIDEPTRSVHGLVGTHSRGLVFDDYAALHEWSITELEDVLAISVGLLRDRVVGAADRRCSRRPTMPGSEVVRWSAAELRGAHRRRTHPAAKTSPSSPDPRRDHRSTLTFGELTALVRRDESRVAAPRRGPWRPCGRLPAEHPRNARRLPRLRQSRGDVGDVCAGVRRTQRRRSVRPDRTDASCSSWPAMSTANTYVDRRRQSPTSSPPCRSIAHVVDVPYGRDAIDAAVARRHAGADGTSSPPTGGRLQFEQLPFDHPLCVLFSSGTTGLPKAIIHAHGGILLEHLKNHVLGWDLGPGDRLMWFSTTAWMMWNALVSTLLTGASIVMLDGNPLHPDATEQWRIAADVGATCWASARRIWRPAGRRASSPVRWTACACVSCAPPARRSLRTRRRGSTTKLGERHPADQRQRRHGRLLWDGAGQPAATCLARSDLGSVPRRGDGGLRPDGSPGGRRARRAGDHRTDAVDAGRLLERSGRRALSGHVLRALSRRVAPGRLGAVRRERQLCRHRSLRRHAQSWRGAPRHRRVLPGRRGVR